MRSVCLSVCLCLSILTHPHPPPPPSFLSNLITLHKKTANSYNVTWSWRSNLPSTLLARNKTLLKGHHINPTLDLSLFLWTLYEFWVTSAFRWFQLRGFTLPPLFFSTRTPKGHEDEDEDEDEDTRGEREVIQGHVYNTGRSVSTIFF